MDNSNIVSIWAWHRTWVKGSFSGVDLWGVNMVVYFYWKQQQRNITFIVTFEQWLVIWLSGHGLEKKNIGERVAKRLGAHLLAWLQSVRICLFCVMITKWQPQQIRLSEITWTRRLFAQRSHSLGWWSKWPQRPAWTLFMGSTARASTVDNVAVTTGECPTETTESDTEPPIWQYFPSKQASHLVTVWLYSITSITEGEAICSFWNRHLFWRWISLHCQW